MPSLTSLQKDFAKEQLRGRGLESNPAYQEGLAYILDLIGGSPESRQAFEAPYKEQFEQYIIPNIAERFAGRGTGAGALSSSALYNSLAQAGKSLETDLASMHEQQRMNALSQLLPFLQQPYSNKISALGYQKPQKSQKPSIWGPLGGLTGMGLGFLGGGPAGAMFGYNAGSNLGNIF
jgi:hypothetical protein